jgi:hypothetical protein
VGLDSGTGNGKYLALPTDHPGKIWTIGLDRSQNLLDLARTAGGNGAIREVVRGDVLGSGWRRGAFVCIICSCHRQWLIRMSSTLQGLCDFNCNDTPSRNSGTPGDSREGRLYQVSLADLPNEQ